MIEPAPSYDATFYVLLGLYMVHWSSFELALDTAIWKLGNQDVQSSLRANYRKVAADKVKQLRKMLVGHPKASEVNGILDRLPSESVRNLICHGIMQFGEDEFVIAMRDRKGQLIYRSFTRSTFATHLRTMSSLALELSTALGHTERDADAIWRGLVNDWPDNSTGDPLSADRRSPQLP